MIGCLRTRVRKQPIIALYLEYETVLKFYNLEASCFTLIVFLLSHVCLPRGALVLIDMCSVILTFPGRHTNFVFFF